MILLGEQELDEPARLPRPDPGEALECLC